MSNPRHAFILLGFLAQALTWDSHIFIFVPVALWFLAVYVLRNRIRISLLSEGAVLVAGCLGSVLINRLLGRTAHFFLGDGLILLQLVRLARPLTRREKLTSLIIACFHFGVLCTLAPNIRFLLLFVASIFLFPKALKEVLLSPDDPQTGNASASAPPLHYPRKFRLPRRVYAGLLAMSILAFIGFPRFTGTPLHLRDAMPNQGSLFDSILDPGRGGKANSREVLMQLEGDYIGYLRCFALSRLNGNIWEAERTWGTPAPMEHNVRELERHHHRKVFIKNPHYLGRVLPVDGQVSRIEGNFFSTPILTQHDAIESPNVWSTGNNTYEYWVRPEPIPQPLGDYQRKALLAHPPQSERLTAWVNQRAAGSTNAIEIARRIEGYLRLNFTYELGTPELNRLSPVEDFVFNRQEGHCERFAAALALMLRMQGIPSRVVIGYLATERNLFSGRLQVRFSDAHAWTEAYIDGQGWVTLDATPGGGGSGVGSNLRNLFEALDFAWYSHVVNFNGFQQRELFGNALKVTSHIPDASWGHVARGLFAALLGLCAFRFKDHLKLVRFWPKAITPAIFARHSYGRMLASFHRAGISKQPHETPIEFLEKLRQDGARGYHEAAVITQAFCQTAYAQQPLAPEAQAQVETALQNLRDSLKKARSG